MLVPGLAGLLQAGRVLQAPLVEGAGREGRDVGVHAVLQRTPAVRVGMVSLVPGMNVTSSLPSTVKSPLLSGPCAWGRCTGSGRPKRYLPRMAAGEGT